MKYLLFLILCLGTNFAIALDTMPKLSQSVEDLHQVKEATMLEINKLEVEIAKNKQTMEKSNALIATAATRSDANAQKAGEMGKQAFSKASMANTKNNETLQFYKAYLDALNRKIEILSTLNPPHKNTSCECSELVQKYDGFKRAIANFSKTTQMNTQEYEKWEKELKEALKESLEAVLDGVLMGADKLFKHSDEKILGLQRQIDAYEAKLANSGKSNAYLIAQTREKLSKAQSHFKKGVIDNLILEGTANEKKAYNIYKSLKNSVELSQKEVEKGYAQVADIQKNTETKLMFNDSLSTFVESAIEYEAWFRKSNLLLQKLNLAVSGFILLKDTTYAGMHATMSFNRLVEFGKAGEENYKAVQSLIEHKKAIEAQLKQCGCQYDF